MATNSFKRLSHLYAIYVNTSIAYKWMDKNMNKT